MTHAQKIRINKLLSQLGIASRRKADELVGQGAVSVNGKPLKGQGFLIDPACDKISVFGKPIDASSFVQKAYFLLNKPVGYISTTEDTHGRRKITDLVPKVNGLFSVGRLDKDTTGLIILTNDGELANRLMHPRYGIEKIYEVVINGLVSSKDINKLSRGVDIGDERPSAPEVLQVSHAKGRTKMMLKLHEGRKRQIRRSFMSLGYKVASLCRTAYAGLRLDIKEGECRPLTEAEIISLKNKTGL